ncbi:MAG: PKD domain-containing protein [Planctomycetota bacterium]|nr:PKD domain-containing protein [Planctomycetota bacterium]
MLGILQRTTWAVVMAVAIASLGLSVWAADAVDRGITDSVVTTIVGGNTGNGATDATTMPLTQLNGGITQDSAGNIYYTDNNRIIKQTGAAVAVFAGQNNSGSAAEGVKAANARFDGPSLLTAAANNIYVLDYNNGRIRKIDSSLVVTTVAGNGNFVTGVIADIGRVATDARLPNNIVGMAVNAAGDIFFADNSTNCIYKVAAADKRLSIVAGDGTAGASKDGASVVSAPLGGWLQSLALLSDGTLIYSTNAGAIRNIKADNTSVVIAGVVDKTAGPTLNDVVSQDALYPDDGTKNALQSITATVTLAQVGGVDPGPLAVDGSTIYFFDWTENRIRQFTVGGTIKTVFGEVSEGGQTTAGGFRGEGTLAAPSTPRLGVVVTAGPNGFIDSAPGGDDLYDGSSRPDRIFSGPNGVSDTALLPDDVAATAAADDQTPRNDDPRCRVNGGQLVAAGGVVTFVDDGNAVVRQFTVGSNVNTIAGTTNAIRRNNGIGNNGFGGTTPGQFQKDSTDAAVPALGAAISNPSQVARDSSGNLFFDANDIRGNHNIYKYDAAAKTVAVVAGKVITSGYRPNHGDGGPAATANLTGLGTQVSVLADGTFLFADTIPGGLSSQTIRAVSPAGVISTVCGIPGLVGNFAPDVDHTTVKANGTLVNPNSRVGQKATGILLNGPSTVLATSTSDFLVGNWNDWTLLVVSGGNVTVDLGVTRPDYLASVSATVAVAASSWGTLTRVDYTRAVITGTSWAAGLATIKSTAHGLLTGATVTINGVTPAGYNVAGAITVLDADTFTIPTWGADPGAYVSGGFVIVQTVMGTLMTPCRGLVSGTIGATPVIFVLGAVNQIDVRKAADLTPFYTVAPTTAVLPGGVNATGFGVNGTNLVIADSTGDTLRTLALSLFTTGTSAPVPTTLPGVEQFPIVAGQFSNVLVNGYNLQTNFQFTAYTPVGSIGTDILVGDDGANQYRKVTLGTAPASTFTIAAGTGAERVGGADGGPATATTIGLVEGIAVDASGGVFFTDRNDYTVRKVAGGTVSLVAGIPGRFGRNQPNNVSALTSELSNSMGGLAFNAAGELHIADTGNNIVRKVKTDGTIVTVAGIDEGFGGGGGEGGDPLAARLNGPHKIAFDATGDLYIGENTTLARLHVVSKNNVITTIAGFGSDNMDYNLTDAYDVRVQTAGLALDTGGKIYFSDGYGHSAVGRVAGGMAQAVVGGVYTGYNGDGLPGTQTLLDYPKGLAFDPTLGLIIVDSGNDRIRAVTNLAETTNSPPEAVIIATPARLGAAPLKVKFDGSHSADADGDIVTWEWDFGDGTKGNGSVVEHVYAALGSYVVTLTVTDTQAHTSTASMTVFAALPMIQSNTNGKGAFKVAFGPKAGTKDSFALAMKNVPNLTAQVGKAAKIYIGSFSIDATVGGKGIKVTSKTVKLAIDPSVKKKTVTIAIKGVKLSDAMIALGVKNENTVAPGKTVLIPVVIVVDNGALVLGDNFLFVYKGKYNSGASGKFSQ